jgi:hypothetical protein
MRQRVRTREHFRRGNAGWAMNVAIVPNPHILIELIGLTMHGPAGVRSHLLTARDALRHRQERMAQDRRARYRPDAEWELGPTFLPALSAGFRRREIEAYRTHRAYALSVCLRLRAQIATGRVALKGLEAEDRG